MKLTLGKLVLKDKLILFGVGAVAATALMTNYVYYPQGDELVDLQAKYQQESAQVRFVETFAKSHPDMDAYLTSLTQKWQSVSQKLPETPAITDWFSQLEAAANLSGVQLVLVKPGLPVAKEGFQETQLEVGVKGNFFQSLIFFKKMDESPRFNTITLLSVHADKGQLESKLLVKIFNVKH